MRVNSTNELHELGRIRNGRILMQWRDPLVYFQVFGVCAVQFFMWCFPRSSLKAFNNHFTCDGARLCGQSDFMCAVVML